MTQNQLFSNDLTDSIEKNEDLMLEDVLLHKDFPISIENNSSILYKRILSNNGEWMKKIIEYALFDCVPPSMYQDMNEVHQINHNAANFLEDCGEFFVECLHSTVFDNDSILEMFFNGAIDRFISKKNTLRTNPMYAGHFQRFIQNFLNLKLFVNEDKIIQKIIPFLINNCQILAYQQLLSNILSDFSTIYKKITYDIVELILRCSYEAVKFAGNSRSKNPNKLHRTPKKPIFREMNQPFNTNKKHIPLISTNFNQVEAIFHDEDLYNSNKWNSETDNIIYNQYDSEEDAEMLAYLLLMSLRTSIKKNHSLLELFRNDDNHNYLLIEALLYCGTHCSCSSIISLESFKILDIIFNGSISMHIDPWMLLEEEKKQLNFYSKYAENFVFDANNLTSQMINALPIFWNHRYNIDTYIMSDEEKRSMKISDYYSDKKHHEIQKQKGETALEILQPILLSEPPISSQLIFEVQDIFTKLSKRRKYLYETESDDIKIRNEMVSIDMTLLSFYQHQINFGQDEMKTFIDFASKNFPLSPTNGYYDGVKELIRPVMNGFFFNFMLQMNSSKNCFFSIDDSHFFSNIGRSEIMNQCSNCFSVIYAYESSTKTDYIPEKILYNDFEGKIDPKQKDSDDYRSINKTKIIVDELSTKKRKKKKIKKKKSKNQEKQVNDIKSNQFNLVFLSSEIIDNLEIIKEVGSGASSTVYKVKSKDIQDPNNKYLAHKVLNLEVIKNTSKKSTKRWSDDSDDDDDVSTEKEDFLPQVDFEKVKSLLNEYEIVRSLNHPNIIKAFGFYIGDDGHHPPSILLEYFRHTLANSVKELENIELVLIIYEICSVMNHIHKNASMIHRDLKPENILLDSKKHVKLCDFGTAKLIDIESQTNLSLTHRVGTIPYMAPELLNDSGNYDRKVDVYAFGVILYFIIAKDRPKISTIDVMAGKKAEIPSTFTKFAKELILKCWSFLPKDRPEFQEIIDMIIKNNFMLFNGISDDQINDLKKKLDLT